MNNQSIDIKTIKKDYQITEFCHHFIRRHVSKGDICVDATAGNGNDTEFLCRLVGESGKVYAFDIQEDAINHTNERLTAAGLQAELILDGHEKMEQYVSEAEAVACVVFNFGYLPGGDHELATKAETSIQAIEAGLHLLRRGGLMSLCIYSGGDSGFDEKTAILEYLKTLDGKKYLVVASDYYNRPNNPPMPVQIVKL